MKVKKRTIIVSIISLIFILNFLLLLSLSIENHQLKQEKLYLDRLAAITSNHLFTDIYYLQELEEKILNTTIHENREKLLYTHKHLVQSFMYHADTVALTVNHQEKIAEDYQKLDYSLREAFVKFDEATEKEERIEAINEVKKAVIELENFVNTIYNRLGIRPEVI